MSKMVSMEVSFINFLRQLPGINGACFFNIERESRGQTWILNKANQEWHITHTLIDCSQGKFKFCNARVTCNGCQITHNKLNWQTNITDSS